MTAAIALAIVLVIAVVGASMAMESQRGPEGAPAPGPSPRTRPPAPPPGSQRRPRARDRVMGRSNPPSAGAPPTPPPPADPEPDIKPPEFVRTGAQADARVLSVVDERTIGPVTRSRLNLKIQPEGKEPFEVTIRWAFQTPDERAKVRVGGMIPVRYDPDDTNRVVVDMPQD